MILCWLLAGVRRLFTALAVDDVRCFVRNLALGLVGNPTRGQQEDFPGEDHLEEIVQELAPGRDHDLILRVIERVDPLEPLGNALTQTIFALACTVVLQVFVQVESVFHALGNGKGRLSETELINLFVRRRPFDFCDDWVTATFFVLFDCFEWARRVGESLICKKRDSMKLRDSFLWGLSISSSLFITCE